MRAGEFITEAVTDTVYHYTSTHNAARIFNDGVFKLSSVSGNPSEASYAPAGYPYFFSTSRSRVGDYHRYVGTGGVMFVLDGRWFNSRYPAKPIDYWDRSWQHAPDRTRETEDRIFSKDPTIPIDGVVAVHVLLAEKDESRSPLTRFILLSAKKRGIKTYLYTNETAWRLQDTRQAVDIGKTGDLLKGTARTDRFDRPVRGVAARRGGDLYGRSSLLDWIELLKKTPGIALSKTADKLRYNMQYYGDTSGVLANDMFNAKKPSSSEYDLANQLVKYMTANNLNIQQFVDQLKNKWTVKRS
jgi:hypothetical protein